MALGHQLNIRPHPELLYEGHRSRHWATEATPAEGQTLWEGLSCGGSLGHKKCGNLFKLTQGTNFKAWWSPRELFI